MHIEWVKSGDHDFYYTESFFADILVGSITGELGKWNWLITGPYLYKGGESPSLEDAKKAVFDLVLAHYDDIMDGLSDEIGHLEKAKHILKELDYEC